MAGCAGGEESVWPEAKHEFLLYHGLKQWSGWRHGVPRPNGARVPGVLNMGDPVKGIPASEVTIGT